MMIFCIFILILILGVVRFFLLIGIVSHYVFLYVSYNLMSVVLIKLKSVLVGSLHTLNFIYSVGDYFLSFTEIILRSALDLSLRNHDFVDMLFSDLYFTLKSTIIETIIDVALFFILIWLFLIKVLLLAYVGTFYLLSLGVDYLAFAFIVLYLGALTALSLILLALFGSLHFLILSGKYLVLMAFAFYVGAIVLLYFFTLDADLCRKKWRNG